MDNKQSGDAVAYPLKQSNLVGKVLGKEYMIIDFCFRGFSLLADRKITEKIPPCTSRDRGKTYSWKKRSERLYSLVPKYKMQCGSLNPNGA